MLARRCRSFLRDAGNRFDQRYDLEQSQRAGGETTAGMGVCSSGSFPTKASPRRWASSGTKSGFMRQYREGRFMTSANQRPKPLKHVRVLVVEDHQDSADLLQLTLNSWGCDARVCRSG